MHRHEVFFGKKIVFPGLVNHANLVKLGSSGIRDDLIELSQFERGSVVLVLDANDKVRFGSLH